MDIQSITSSLGAYAGVSNQGAQTQSAQGTRQNQQVQAVEQREPQAAEREEKPRPVVNTLGQQTGTLINVTA